MSQKTCATTLRRAKADSFELRDARFLNREVAAPSLHHADMAKKKTAGKPKRTLMTCVAAGDVEGVRELVAKKAVLNKLVRGYENSALAEAIEQGSLDMVRTLIELGHDPNFGVVVHPLAHAVRHADQQMIEFLLTSGADVDGEEQEGDTAVMFAAAKGDVNLIKRLIKAGADIKHKDQEGHDALDFAAQGTSSEMLDFLLPQFPKSRADAIRRQAHIVREKLEAAKKPHPIVQIIEEAAKKPVGKALLCGATCASRHNQFLKLLAEGADPNETNNEGTTVLGMVGAYWSGIDLVEPLLKAGTTRIDLPRSCRCNKPLEMARTMCGICWTRGPMSTLAI